MIGSVFWGLLVFVGLAEISLQVLVRKKKRSFQWLIYRSDARPNFPTELVKKYVETSFDAELGWARKPNTIGTDKSPEGDATFRIANDGSRHNPITNNRPGEIAVFGDSFAFCRLVNDHETWPYYLAKKTTKDVSNFGVGNYGLDQALLRMMGQEQPKERRIAVMAVVPETILRIHSRWKHYFEYGNILAFKPTYVLAEGELKLLSNPIKKKEDFSNLCRIYQSLEKEDPFFRQKFLRDALVPPFLFGFLRNPVRLTKILLHLYLERGERGRAAAFRAVLSDNHKYQNMYYRNEMAVSLLFALVDKFANECRHVGVEPVLMVFPQPNDMVDEEKGEAAYREVFKSMEKTLPVLDLMDLFIEKSACFDIYKNGELGDHTSPKMNEAISERLFVFLKEKEVLN